MAHFNGSILPNATYSGGTVSHVGQIFFDQSLITEVDTVSPYSENTQTLTLNSEDSILSQEAATGDPVVQYSLLGDDISEGIFAWISFGIDLTVQETVSPAVYYGEDGGVANADSNAGGPGGNGTMPTGTPPSGAAPAGSASATASVSAAAATSTVA